MSLLYTLAAFVIALGILIVVHEYGHYLAGASGSGRIRGYMVAGGGTLLLDGELCVPRGRARGCAGEA